MSVLHHAAHAACWHSRSRSVLLDVGDDTLGGEEHTSDAGSVLQCYAGHLGWVNYTATYNETVNKYTITATAENGTVQGTGEYDYGTVVELMAIADTGYKFDKWSDEVTDNPRMVTVTENMEFTALFISDVGASIEDIHATSNKVQKVLIDGILYILRDGKTYNTMGQEM